MPYSQGVGVWEVRASGIQGRLCAAHIATHKYLADSKTARTRHRALKGPWALPYSTPLPTATHWHCHRAAAGRHQA